MAAIDMLEMVMLTMFNASPVYTSLSDFYAKNPRLFQIKRQGRWILDIYLYTSIPLSTFLTTMARLHANKLLLDDPSASTTLRPSRAIDDENIVENNTIKDKIENQAPSVSQDGNEENI